MCKCSHTNCQFVNFFQDDNNFYVEDKENNDQFCIFHAPEKLKQGFTEKQNEIFSEKIEQYIQKQISIGHDIDFSFVVFHLSFNYKIEAINYCFLWKTRDIINEEKISFESDLSVDFSNAVFLEYFRVDNIKCETLIMKDTLFHKGGAIKNFRQKAGVYIDKFIFRPYQVDSDFVVDIGRYAGNDGFIQTQYVGIIRNIEFENHKEGEGVIYFIGLNNMLKRANFRNRILDKVSFQNCDLSECYFLNAKIDKTEFRNCNFPQGHIYKSYDVLRGKLEQFIPLLLLITIAIGVFYMFFGNQTYVHMLGDQLLTYLYTLKIPILLLLPILILFFFYTIASIFLFVEAKISDWGIENSKHGIHTLNILKYIGRHFSIADEVKLYHILKDNKGINSSDKKQILESFTALSAQYIQLKNNFSKYDHQMAGNFFYTQRYFELLTSRNKDQMTERLMLSVHHFVNGFGERFIRPLLWFMLTIVIFSYMFYYLGKEQNNSSIHATNMTPQFLLDKKTDFVTYKKLNIKTIDKQDKNCSVKYTKKEFQERHLKENYSTALLYSFSRFVSPITSNAKAWFKTEDERIILLGLFETSLLLFFFGAFILALRNRIKR